MPRPNRMSDPRKARATSKRSPKRSNLQSALERLEAAISKKPDPAIIKAHKELLSSLKAKEDLAVKRKELWPAKDTKKQWLNAMLFLREQFNSTPPKFKFEFPDCSPKHMKWIRKHLAQIAQDMEDL